MDLLSTYRDAEKNGVAVGHFNVSDLTALKGVVGAAQELGVPVVIGASEGERKFLGDQQLASLVKSYRDETDQPVFLNADHTHSLEAAIAAAKAGFDSIVFEISALPIEENIQRTKEAMGVLKKINPANLIEGEIGDIGSGSQIHDSVPDLSKGLTSPEEAKQFVDATGVDILAPAVGNMHGMVASVIQGSEKKRLDIRRISEIKRAIGSLITLQELPEPMTRTAPVDCRRNQYHSHQHIIARGLAACTRQRSLFTSIGSCTVQASPTCY